MHCIAADGTITDERELRQIERKSERVRERVVSSANIVCVWVNDGFNYVEKNRFYFLQCTSVLLCRCCSPFQCFTRRLDPLLSLVFFFFYSLLFFRIPLFFSLKISITKNNSTQQKCAAFRLPSIGIFMSAYF